MQTPLTQSQLGGQNIAKTCYKRVQTSHY